MRKLAIIRTNEDSPCPYGLDVPYGCENAGDLIEKLYPLDSLDAGTSDEDINQIKKANNRLFLWNNPGQKCKYAGQLIPQKNAVECNARDTAPGSSGGSVLRGSPFYAQLFNGIGLEGLNSYPIDYFGDMNTSRNAYYSLYSLNSSDILNTELIKLANEIVELIFKNKKFY